MMRWSPAQAPRPACPHRRLRRLLARELPDGFTLETSTLRPWASANFVGARHMFRCIVPNDGNAVSCRALHERLNLAPWTLPSHIVADVAVESGESADEWRIEMLTVED